MAYIRALQLSQNAKTADATPGATIASLAQVTKQQGLPPEFAESDWTGATTPAFPGTSVYATAQPAAAAAAAAAAANSAAQQPNGVNSSATAQSDSPPADQPPVAEVSAGDPAAGKQLYLDNCAVCHQPGRQGVPSIFPSLIGIIDKVGAAKVRMTVTTGIPTGKPPMPSFASKFSSTDFDNLIAFLKTKP